MEISALGRKFRGQIRAVEDRIKAVKTQLADPQFALEKLANEASSSEANLRVKNVAVEGLLNTEQACVERPKRKLVTESEQRQQLLAERQKTSQTSGPSLLEGGSYLCDLRLGVATLAESWNEWHVLATRAKKAKSD